MAFRAPTNRLPKIDMLVAAYGETVASATPATIPTKICSTKLPLANP